MCGKKRGKRVKKEKKKERMEDFVDIDEAPVRAEQKEFFKKITRKEWKTLFTLTRPRCVRRKSDAFTCMSRVKRGLHVAKETYVRGKKDLHAWQKRPTCVSKETYSCTRLHLYVCPPRSRLFKRGLTAGKQAYLHVAKETCMSSHSPGLLATRTA